MTDPVGNLLPLLSIICAQTDWQYGEFWIPDPTHQLLELSPAWCIDFALESHQQLAWSQFQMCSRSFVLRFGEGMPGRVWQSQQAEWIDDVSAETERYFLRDQIARAMAVKAGFGMPIRVHSQTIAVVVFFMSKARSPDQELIAKTQALAETFQQALEQCQVMG
jgi:putative methionine-R-sulfoxide reductase with GAF domain